MEHRSRIKFYDFMQNEKYSRIENSAFYVDFQSSKYVIQTLLPYSIQNYHQFNF